MTHSSSTTLKRQNGGLTVKNEYTFFLFIKIQYSIVSIMENIMDEKNPEERLEERESVKFGYGATIVFLIFIGFVIYISVTK